MFNLAVKNFFEKNLPLKVYGNLNCGSNIKSVYGTQVCDNLHRFC